jgi:hypothetical protein
MASTAPDTLPKVQWVTPEEGREIFDAEARRVMGMSGEEFIRRWDAGEYREIADTPGNLHIIGLAFLIPLARQDT